ncbi:haloacid dehalogenase type II [Roseicyclus mahoneyensis]|uniref:(S)-2-haloacid dehalogenase n=1 Tax=Roseicyclus mahoneyensis TaxID=164332 RepID=A0A316GP93_9RHOB|nr:haloacid dehalogenase type II [Roseicyclus mahoneyensis]PWK62181.1 2-haloacid dehalogenase [Roseicyclus mahoneyensis]
MTKITTCVFDAYGTLFDVNAAARALAGEPGRATFAAVWQQVSADWRTKQLQYSWLRAITGDHCDFWQVTQDGLDWALDRAGIDDPDLRNGLLGLYRRLKPYPEVPALLTTLKTAGLARAILSNGSPGMLEEAVASAGIGALLDDVLSVEDVGVFKPDARVYDLVGARLACTPDQVLFVSANGWDAAAAAAYGFRTLLVNRAGDPVDRLPGRPENVAADLGAVRNILGL